MITYTDNERKVIIMIKISGINLPAAVGDSGLKRAIAGCLKISESLVKGFQIIKKSLDSRKKADVHFVYTVAVEVSGEAAILAKVYKNMSAYSPSQWCFPYAKIKSASRPVVVGLGPAGLFAALALAEAGVPPIILERGKTVEERTRDVERFWNEGALNELSNVQFGEGGAGTFSDGKLTTGVSDSRTGYVFRRFVEFGASEDILYLAKPHIGTDKLRTVVRNMREHLIALGCDIRFESQLTDIVLDGDRLRGIVVSHLGEKYTLETESLILAPGNSARDTFKMLNRHGLRIEAKPFAVGVRIEHLQREIDMAQYGEAATLGTLPAADYKLAVHLENGRSVFTFCVCPGGSVVASASEHGGVVTNGMSEYARDGKNINGGLLVSVTPEDYPNSALDGIRFQRELEQSAFRHGGEDYRAPAQLVGDFIKHRASTVPGKVEPSYMPGVHFCNLWDVLPEFICEAICDALPLMERKIHGFSAHDAVLTAVETRSSSPVRIVRDETMQSSVYGIFPSGEGAGYAGGITSAAVDGLKTAEAVCTKLLAK